MADPRKLQGTEEFLCLSLLGLLHRSGDKGCSGSLGLANVCKQEEVPCPLDVLPIWRESCHRGVVTSVRRWPPPQPLAGTLRVQTHTGPHFLPRLRGTAQSLKDTDLRRGLHTCRQERGKWVDPGYVASECTLEMTLPPSCPHSTVTIPCGDRGNCSSSPRSPLLALSATWRPTPGAPEGSRPALSIRSRGACSGRLSHSWLLPSEQGKSRKGVSFN